MELRKLSTGSPKDPSAFHYILGNPLGTGFIDKIKFREDLYSIKGKEVYEIWASMPNEADPERSDIVLWKTIRKGDKDTFYEEKDLNI